MRLITVWLMAASAVKRLRFIVEFHSTISNTTGSMSRSGAQDQSSRWPELSALDVYAASLVLSAISPLLSSVLFDTVQLLSPKDQLIPPHHTTSFFTAP